MNERIKELAEQAEQYALDKANEPEEDFEFSFDDDFQKKFAELIVKECYLWAKENGGLGCEEDFEALKEHFGVEE